MENASKALIIAGAILLSIALIGIGMVVLNTSSQTATEGADMSAEKAQAYNAKFSSYEGRKNGATVKSLLDTIRTHNASSNGDNSKVIVVNANGRTILAEGRTVADSTGTGTAAGRDSQPQTAANITTIKNLINNGQNYNVSFGYSTTGYIKFVGIATI